MAIVKAALGDITEIKADAIVNAANESLILGAGVAGAIRRKGGQKIQNECDRLSPIPTGTAAVTCAGNLPYKAIIHAVAPTAGMKNWQKRLANAVHASIIKGDKLGIKSIALPALGTGIFNLSINEAAAIMVSEALKTAQTCKSLTEIIFCLYDKTTYDIFNATLNAVNKTSNQQ